MTLVEKKMEGISNFYTRTVNELKAFTESLRLLWKQEPNPVYRMRLVTGDKRGAGTDANVYVVLHDASKCSSKILRPQSPFANDHERESSTFFDFGLDSGVSAPFEKLEIWRDSQGAKSLPFGLNKFVFGGRNKDSSDWFLDRVEITPLKEEEKSPLLENIGSPPIKDSENEVKALRYSDVRSTRNKKTIWVFPVHRWIKSDLRYVVPLYDCVLPQEDERTRFRLEELECKKKAYVYAEKVKGGPVQVSEGQG